MAKVTCSVCGKEVAKRKTYYLDTDLVTAEPVNGEAVTAKKGTRVCRDHKGVTKHAEQRKEQEKKRILNQQKEAQKPRHQGRYHSRRHESVSTGPVCWVCRKEGIGARDFYMQKVIDMEKHKIVRGTTNPFTDKDHPMHIRTEQPVLFTVSRENMPGDIRDKVWESASRDFRDLMQIAGIVSICGDCCKKVGFDPLPKISVAQMENMMTITLGIQPILEHIALKQMSEDN